MRHSSVLVLVALVTVAVAAPQQGQAPDYGNSPATTTIQPLSTSTPATVPPPAAASSSGPAVRAIGEPDIGTPLPLGPEANPPLFPTVLGTMVPRDYGEHDNPVSQDSSNLNGAHTLALLPTTPYEALPTYVANVQPKAAIAAFGTSTDLGNLNTAAVAAPTFLAHDIPSSDTIAVDRRTFSDNFGSFTSVYVGAITSYAPQTLSANIGFARRLSGPHIGEDSTVGEALPTALPATATKNAGVSGRYSAFDAAVAADEIIPAVASSGQAETHPVASHSQPSPHHADMPQPDSYSPTGTPTRRTLSLRISKLNRLGVDEFSNSVEEIYRTSTHGHHSSCARTIQQVVPGTGLGL